MAPQKKKAKVANVEEVKVVADTTGPCYLFDKLHDGVLRMILEYAVTEDRPITPLQIKEKSNKFAWDVRQKKGDGKGFKLTGGRFHIKELVAVQLCSVSKKMYDLVAGSHLLYTQNKFEFLTNHGLHTYLAAITPHRRGQIKHMEIQLPNPYPTHGHNVSDAFTLLSTCQKLETLVIVVHALEIQGLPKDRADILAFLSKLRGIKQLFLAVRGIKSVVCKTATENHRGSYLLTSAEFVALAAKFRNFIDPFLQDEKEKAKQILPKGVVGKAITSAGLQIEGEGRLGGDRKSIISSRTRQSLRLEKDISIEGVLPPLEPSRLDADGNLTASVWDVMGSRKSSDDVYGVEFYVHYGPAGMEHTGKGSKSWESVAVLDTCHARYAIANYYRHHPGAFGMQEVVDIWKVGLKGYDKDDILEKAKVTYLEYLSDWIKEQKMRAKQMAEEAEEAREKAAAAAANKKAEAKKKKAEAMKKKTQATKQKGRLASKKVTATPSGKRKPSHS